MAESCLPKVRTQCSPLELYQALRAAWPSVCGDDPRKRESILVLLSQWAFETGWGGSCWCWNLGNWKHVAGDGRDYTMFRCSEVLGGKEVWYDPPHPATWFRAYKSLDAGAVDYLAGLRSRFSPAWPAVLAGDPAEFCRQLKMRGYFTADEAVYTRGLSGCYARLSGLIAPDTAPDLPAILHPDVVADAVQTSPDELPEVDS